MNILLISDSLNRVGGGQRVTLNMIEALKEKNHIVCLCSLVKPDWAVVEKIYGKVVTKPDLEEYIFKSRREITAYERTILPIFFLKWRKWADLIFDGFDLLTRALAKDYMCYLPAAPLLLQKHEKYDKGLWKIYIAPINAIDKLSIKTLNPQNIIAMSNYTSMIVEKKFGSPAKVIYPPVNIGGFNSNRNKENLICCVGRFTKEKNYGTVIKAFKHVKNGKLLIMGGIISRDSKLYVEELKKLRDTLELKGKVNFLVGSPFDVIRDNLSRAKVYIHAREYEPFGISAVEAAASGCALIVHRSGGPYIDIVNYDRFGLSFETAKELSDNINKLLEDEEFCKEYSKKAIERSKMFSEEIFKKGLQHVISDRFKKP
jgi:glycosyltransferase involved in cell wall biosynthesis